MVTKKSILAKSSKLGHYNFQYPDLESTGAVIPKGSNLSELHWVGNDGYTAWLWESNNGNRVVWIREDENK